MIYKTKLFTLEPLTMENISPFYKNWFANYEICQWNSHGRRFMFQEDVDFFVENLLSDKSRMIWAIIFNANVETDVIGINPQQTKKVHVGNISLQKIDYINRTAELTFLLGNKEMWGKGVGFNAGMFILYHAFDVLNLNRVTAGTVDRNFRMVRLALKLGMKCESIKKSAFYKDSEYFDVQEYVIFANEWRINFESLPEKLNIN